MIILRGMTLAEHLKAPATFGDVDLTLDPIIVRDNSTGQVATADAGPPITGDAAPKPTTSWWPWVVIAAIGGVVWWLVAHEEEGSGDAAPFVG